MEEENANGFDEDHEQHNQGVEDEEMVEPDGQLSDEEGALEPTMDDIQRERLRHQREQHLDSLERFFIEIGDNEIFEMLTMEELRMRQERLKHHFRRFENADTLYRNKCILVTNYLFVDVENRYMNVMAKIQAKLKDEISMHSCSSSTPTGNDGRLPSIIKVETTQPPKIGKFDGKPANWPAFRDLFMAEVHNKDIDDVMKLLYLQEACVDKAALTLGPWQPLKDNYRVAWEVLTNAYDDNYHVIHSILGKMHAVPVQDRETHDSIRTVLDSLNSSVRQLQTIAPQATLWDQMLIHHAKRRLPKYTLDSWEQHRHRAGVTTLPTLDEFKIFLDIKAKGRRELEGNEATGHEMRLSNIPFKHIQRGSGGFRYQPYPHSNQRTRPPQETHSRPVRLNDSRTHTQNERGGCMMQGCTQRHPIYMCDLFKQADIKERWAQVFKHKLCKCCLNAGHSAQDCKRDGCSSCPDGPKHHFRLCNRAQHNSRPAITNQPHAGENKQ